MKQKKVQTVENVELDSIEYNGKIYLPAEQINKWEDQANGWKKSYYEQWDALGKAREQIESLQQQVKELKEQLSKES